MWRVGFAGLLILVQSLLIPASISVAAASQASIVAAPLSGHVGTVFTVSGADFPPNWATARLNISTRLIQAAPVHPTVAESVEVIVGTDGGFRAFYDSSALAAGQYMVFVWSQNAPDRVIAETIITVTAPSQPSLPTTGGGGMVAHPHSPSWNVAMEVVLLVALVWCLRAGRKRV